MTALHYVIIGNGVAGVTAAQEIRKLDGDGKITIVSDEDEYYYRASLSEWISNRNTEEMMNGRTALFYDEMRLERVFGTVTQVDPAAHQVMIGQKRLDYDRLLIATGAQPNQISIPGLEESLVFRSFKDARDIQEQVGCCNRVLILGRWDFRIGIGGRITSSGYKRCCSCAGYGLCGRPTARSSCC